MGWLARHGSVSSNLQIALLRYQATIISSGAPSQTSSSCRRLKTLSKYRVNNQGRGSLPIHRTYLLSNLSWGSRWATRIDKLPALHLLTWAPSKKSREIKYYITTNAFRILQAVTSILANISKAFLRTISLVRTSSPEVTSSKILHQPLSLLNS